MQAGLDDIAFHHIGAATGAIIEGEGGHCLAVLVADWAGPACPQTQGLRQCAIIGPEGVIVDIGDHYRLFGVGSGAARAGLWPNGKINKRCRELWWQAGSRERLNPSRAINGENGADGAGGHGFGPAAQQLGDRRNRLAASDCFKHLGLQMQQ